MDTGNAGCERATATRLAGRACVVVAACAAFAACDTREPKPKTTAFAFDAISSAATQLCADYTLPGLREVTAAAQKIVDAASAGR
jgi:hypothetical protein